jgi:hypothetical protein
VPSGTTCRSFRWGDAGLSAAIWAGEPRLVYDVGQGPTPGMAKTEERMEKVNLAEKFALITEHWRPKIVGALNG